MRQPLLYRSLPTIQTNTYDSKSPHDYRVCYEHRDKSKFSKLRIALRGPDMKHLPASNDGDPLTECDHSDQ